VRFIARHRSESDEVIPQEGLVAVVNTTSLTVVEISDAPPLPPRRRAADDAEFEVQDPPLRPLRITQPKGPSFVLAGNSISWQGWTLRFALHPREGLVLYDVHRAARGMPPIPVMKRASIAEMLVPYGDPSEAWSFRSVFDVGEFGLGRNAASLIPGEDVPENAQLVDAVLASETGEPNDYPRVIAVYERDGGLRWRHAGMARRARELVVRFATTVGNYDYGFGWVLSMDGTLAMEIDLTGSLMIKNVGADDEKASSYGTTVAPGISAIHHQHFFTFRLDMDVGGTTNRISEIDAAVMPHEHGNPHGTAFTRQATLLNTEETAARDVNPASGRVWRIESAADGNRAAYTLFPGPLPQLLSSPAASVASRGAFATRALWVTRYRQDERYPAGDYPSQSSGGQGLPAWVADDESIVDTDLVLWYTMGTVHFPRPEEWPRMPVSRMRFELRPDGFLPAANGVPEKQ
jgi:primary-amine oxidase